MVCLRHDVSQAPPAGAGGAGGTVAIAIAGAGAGAGAAVAVAKKNCHPSLFEPLMITNHLKS